jgi:hypothetical protein
MITNLRQAKWTPVEPVGWQRRAYGRTIKYESEGGTLRCATSGVHANGGQIYLRFEVTGRMLVQLFCNDAPVFEDLIAHGELDTFVDLRSDPFADKIDVELHLVPATFGSVRIAQDVRFVSARQVADMCLANAY